MGGTYLRPDHDTTPVAVFVDGTHLGQTKPGRLATLVSGGRPISEGVVVNPGGHVRRWASLGFETIEATELKERFKGSAERVLIMVGVAKAEYVMALARVGAKMTGVALEIWTWHFAVPAADTLPPNVRVYELDSYTEMLWFQEKS